MRRVREEELPKVAAFVVERFSGLELFSFLSEGLEQPAQTLAQVAQTELGLFFAKGDVLVADDAPLAVLAGIPSKAYNGLNLMAYSLWAGRALRQLPPGDRALLVQRSRLLSAVYQRTWFRKYTRSCYYIGQLAVAPAAKGTGLFRQMLQPVLDGCQRQGLPVVLETYTPGNVPLYKHFGFEVMETHASPLVPFDEYCLMKR